MRVTGRISLRGRLLAIAMALLATGLAISSGVVVGMLRSHLVGRVDQQLRPLSLVLARVSADRLRPMILPEGSQAIQALTGGLDLVGDVYAAYLDARGAVRRVGGSAGSPPVLSGLDKASVARLGGEPFEVESADGRSSWRVIALPRAARPFPAGEDTPPPEPGSGVVIAASLDGVTSTVGRLAAVCALTGLGLLAMLTAGGWYAVRAGLAPLRRIEETAAAIAQGDLTRRVPETMPPGSEVGRLSAALNGMLVQIEEAFADREESQARMRRFVADVSHELRTPLFGIKGFSDLYRMGGLSGPDDVDMTMARIQSEAARLARLVEDLLLLARLDEGEAAPAMEPAPMDLRSLAADARHDLRALDPAREIRLTGVVAGTPPAGAPVLGDEARLRQVVANLVGNAVAHTPEGTPVRVGVGTRDGEALLVIEDEGPGLDETQAARVFDRFYRVDGSRTRDGGGGGAGLGLSIAQSITRAHGGRVELRTAPGRGAAFAIVLPLA
ncbi:HAMP domain-containing sensor histidine kinase [Spongiactinospora sp. TRM90649]|uniref:sensor histidine kinase n=1 Tax=Spongiactinospora sp. TRM90649 TaxID=3031114 RepID=UPI0023F9B17A|nr:HAMP domain-containing sensor histidine kinase [Spongiactinospora sp. TRM90649]MDF5753899.1 HAMP domain-containing sensor histidine kinase [Spongiactinospora sp. TRM90649]